MSYGAKYIGKRMFKKGLSAVEKKVINQKRKLKPIVKNQRTLKKQVKELKRIAESDMGTHIQRRRSTGVISSSVNSKSIQSGSLCNITLIEEVMAQLRYYDPSAPSALVTADGTTGSYQKEFLFKSIHHNFMLTNNYQVPCKVKIFLVRSREDTSINATTAYTNGLADIGNPTSTSTLVYLTDSNQFNDLYKIVKSSSGYLQPGDSMSIAFTDSPFQYDPSFTDSHALTFQNRYKDLQFVVDVQGPLGHDTVVTTEQTNLQAAVDFELRTTFTVNYSAGADIKYLHIDDEGDTAFTNSGVVSSKPVSDNIGYSLA